MTRLRILTICTTTIALCIFFFKKRDSVIQVQGTGLVINKNWLKTNHNLLTPAKDIRPADQTFLTYPEWYLVFSPEEQANYFKEHTATSFPFMDHTMQIWESYKVVCDQIRDNFPYNTGYHFMIWVIGGSTTVEYTIKAWYETIVGRLTDTYKPLTEEDKFNAAYTKKYVDFIKDRPWYEFDFKEQFEELWNNTPILGTHFLRKVERRYILTSELLVKLIYGKLIGLGTKTVYEDALPTTAIVIDSIPKSYKECVPTKLANNSYLLYLPRYDKFNKAACQLAELNCNFREIAGNNSAILLTIIASPNTYVPISNTQIIFRHKLASDRSKERIALTTPVNYLTNVLKNLNTQHIQIEHIFDF